MTYVEVFSKKDCSLCDKAKEALARVNADFRFEIRETLLEPENPLFSKYKDSFPVLVASNGKSVSGKVTDEQLSDLLVSLAPPPAMYYVAKFLQALAIIVVFFGFMYGLMGDMWTDLYFFLGGIAVFLAGWVLEKQEQYSRKKRKQPA
ncbi:MAG: glutaredoxin family protein [Bacteroidota bacterium]